MHTVKIYAHFLKNLVTFDHCELLKKTKKTYDDKNSNLHSKFWLVTQIQREEL
jgi:hypothetical protein